MKILKIILLGLLAIGLVAVTVIFIFFQTFDVDQHLPQLGQKVSAMLGRPVTIGEVGLGVSSRGGITLDVGPVMVADDRAFTSEPFISIEKVRVSFDVRALLRHHLQVSGIVLQSPEIHFIRSEEGRLNAASFLGFKTVPADHAASHAPVLPSPTVQGMASKPPVQKLASIDLKSIRIVGGKISFIDQGEPFPVDIWIRNIKASIHDFSLSQPFGMDLSAAIYSPKRNLDLKGTVFIGSGKKSLTISDLTVKMDFSSMENKLLAGLSPYTFEDMPFLKNPSGQMRIDLAHADLDSAGNLDIDGDLHVHEVVIKGLNLMQALLTRTIGNFLSGANADALFNGQWTAKDTVIERADADFGLHDKAFTISDAVVKTNVFELTAQGSVDQAQDMDLQTVLHLDAQASSALTGQFDGLKLLCDDSGRITVPASLTGSWGHLKYKPAKDFRKKSTRALMQEGGNILGALLGGPSSQPGPAPGKKLKKNLTNMFKSYLQ